MKKPDHIQTIPSRYEALIKTNAVLKAEEERCITENDVILSDEINKAINNGHYSCSTTFKGYGISDDLLSYLREELEYTVDVKTQHTGFYKEYTINIKWKEDDSKFNINTLYSETRETL